jgi:hypothetical protein
MSETVRPQPAHFTMKEAGRSLQSGRPEQPTEDLIRFVQDHPVATALGALALGYILGKLV